MILPRICIKCNSQYRKQVAEAEGYVVNSNLLPGIKNIFGGRYLAKFERRYDVRNFYIGACPPSGLRRARLVRIIGRPIRSQSICIGQCRAKQIRAILFFACSNAGKANRYGLYVGVLCQRHGTPMVASGYM
jgi:hypothetical protein